jgi:membrane protease YdiL (CAAX protease family)
VHVRTIFVNKANNLRAGWRIAIFLTLQIALSLSIGGFLYSYLHISGLLVEGLGYALLLVTTVIVLRVVDHRPFYSVGLPLHSRLGIEVLQGFFISVLMITLVFVIEFISGFIHVSWRGDDFPKIVVSLPAIFLFFLWFAFGEELLFRGYLFQTLIEGTNKVVAVALLSVTFGLFHLNNPNVTFLAVVNIILAGVWLSVAYLKTRTLWFPTMMHVTWNFFQGYVYSFPVSGLHWGQPSLLRLRQSGPDWITGGHFGPEGGILATAVLIITTIFILKSQSVRIGEGAWLLQPEGLQGAGSANVRS